MVILSLQQTEWPMPNMKEVMERTMFRKWLESPSYNTLNPGIHLQLYYQLSRDFGWGCYHKVRYMLYKPCFVILPSI